MATLYPFASYACPCSDLTSAPLPTTNRRASFQPSTVQLSEDQTINPHSPRANYALYPLEHLLYCDECDAVRCPRCWTEEVLYWYCPACLFEVPSSAVRGDGNRCARSCYSCPCCNAQLAVTQIANQKDQDGFLKPNDAAGENESYILQCPHCEWNSLSIDMHFSKSTKITEQITKLRKARISTTREETESSEPQPPPNHDQLFANLTAFYKEQLSDSTDSQNPYASSPYNSPANLARIMSLYGGLPYNALKKSREKPQPMREALQHSEGLVTYTTTDSTSDATIIEQMQRLGWEGTMSSEQKHSTPMNNDTRFIDDLYPAATPLRTRRGRRCKTCRQFLARPETKVGSMKYRIRLLAINHIPRLSLRILEPGPPPGNPAFHLKTEPLEQEPLLPHEMRQYILTVRNPLFEPVRISLATPATTPGRVSSRVTILCPSFTVGPAGEIWDDALASSVPPTSDGGRSAAMASLTGSSEKSFTDRTPSDGRLGPSAGKVWDRTRNSSSVVLEIVPGSLETGSSIVLTGEKREDEELGEDDDILEIPVYVRAEWEVEVRAGDTLPGRKAEGKELGEKIPKEMGYWVVLSVGQIQSASQ